MVAASRIRAFTRGSGPTSIIRTRRRRVRRVSSGDACGGGGPRGHIITVRLKRGQRTRQNNSNNNGNKSYVFGTKVPIASQRSVRFCAPDEQQQQRRRRRCRRSTDIDARHGRLINTTRIAHRSAGRSATSTSAHRQVQLPLGIGKRTFILLTAAVPAAIRRPDASVPPAAIDSTGNARVDKRPTPSPSL